MISTNQSKLTPTLLKTQIVYRCCTKLIFMKIEEKTVFLLNIDKPKNVNKVAILADQLTKLKNIHGSKSLRSKLIEQCILLSVLKLTEFWKVK